MIGRDYDSLDDFIEACQERRNSLHSEGVLGKIYSIEQLKLLADYCHLSRSEVMDATAQENTDEASSKGIARRYLFAKGIAELRSPEQIGTALSRTDHDCCFSVVTYLSLPETPDASLEQISERLGERYVMAQDFSSLSNGIIMPPGASPDLESILIDRNTQAVSLLFSCSRILLLPEGRQSSFEDYFLARIPVLVRFLFSDGLVEISMPTFCDVYGLGTGWSNTTPEKYQSIVLTLLARLRSIVSVDLVAIQFKKVTLLLETGFSAIDMGWRIEPQPEATFDLTQGALPLRRILEALSDSLDTECKRRGLPLPFDGRNLYNVFRALKEQSYTYSLLLQAPLGRSGGKVRALTLYGRPNTGNLPIILLDKNDKYISEKLREAVCRSQVEEIENPYDLDLIFQTP